MKISCPTYISAEVHARIEPLTIPLVKRVTKYLSRCETVNINMSQNPLAANSEMYKIKIAIFENVQPEEFFALLKNFKTSIDGTGTMLEAGKINCIRYLSLGGVIREFEKLASHNFGTTNAHLKFIHEGLLMYFT